MKTLLIPFIACIMISFNLMAQDKSARERKGDNYSFNYNYDKAIRAYTRTKNLSVEGQRALALSYHKMDQNKLSEESYAKIINAGVGIIPEDFFNYAMVLKMNGKDAESNRWMDQFAALRVNDLRVADYHTNKDRLADMQLNNSEFHIEHQNMNTDALDFGTAYFNDDVVFASTRTKRKIFIRKYNWTNQPFWSMYKSEVKDGQMQTPEVFEKGLNGKLHDGPVSFSNHGTFMAFTRNNYQFKRTDKVIELQIWFSSLYNGKWSKPIPFVHNNSDYSVGHPSLSADGNTLFFSSNMPGGFGGMDLYKATKNNNGTWNLPTNLGSRINTEGDEIFPFLESNSGTLLFSSNGRYGLGGLDIFISHVQGNQFSQPYNPGAPLNTRFDDFAAIVDGQMSQGYFSTNRTASSGGDNIYSYTLKDPDVTFTVVLPDDVQLVRKIRETFPLRNYIFFTKGSTEIPDRYVSLTKDQVKDFKEDQLEEFTSKHPAGRSARQMNVYYNVINILGNRMHKFPNATITLVGSSENGIKDAEAMAGSVKNYLVNTFGIAERRIKIEGRIKPKLPSEKVGGVSELALLREGDQRVSIESSSPAILMEFLSGPDAPLKPVEIISGVELAQDGQVLFRVEGAKNSLSSWSMKIRDGKNSVKHYGPFTDETININRSAIFDKQLKGNYMATMTGKTKMGKIITREALFDIAPVVEPKLAEVMRFSIIYEFDNARAISIYEKYLTDIVTPKIPLNAKVVIRGYTDIIGNVDHNQKLSHARAHDVKRIIEASLNTANRTDVSFDVRGLGADVSSSPFDNTYPEERFYNRTVIIDIVPK